MPETPLQEFHRLAKHAGSAEGCQVCEATEKRQAAARRRFNRHQRELSARVKRLSR